MLTRPTHTTRTGLTVAGYATRALRVGGVPPHRPHCPFTGRRRRAPSSRGVVGGGAKETV